MNVEIGIEAPIFLFWEYLFQIFGILSLQCDRIVTGVKISYFVYVLGKCNKLLNTDHTKRFSPYVIFFGFLSLLHFQYLIIVGKAKNVFSIIKIQYTLMSYCEPFIA
jgi:hypothetical protein